MVFRSLKIILMLYVAGALVACGGGGSGTPPAQPATAHSVTLSWAANRDAEVNSIGGGYKVAITGQAVIDVPFPYAGSNPSVTTTLMSGNYTATVTAYSATSPVTGMPAAGIVNSALPSIALAINVPY